MIAGLVLAALAGCESAPSSAPESTPDAAPEPAGGIGRVAIFPSRELSFLPESFDYLYPEMDASLARWLQANELAVVKPETVDAAIAELGDVIERMKSPAPGVAESAVEDLVWKLRDREDVTLLIVPQLLVRTLMVEPPYRGVDWDGVSRDLHVIGGIEGAEGVVQLDVATLNVGVCSRRGQPQYFGVGGVTMLENGVRAGDRVYTAPRRREQIPAADLERSVEIALRPWIAAGGARKPPGGERPAEREAGTSGR